MGLKKFSNYLLRYTLMNSNGVVQYPITSVLIFSIISLSILSISKKPVQLEDHQFDLGECHQTHLPMVERYSPSMIRSIASNVSSFNSSKCVLPPQNVSIPPFSVSMYVVGPPYSINMRLE